jgi:tripartite-type tricarboxylate transporter receptor subunit TctC
MLKRVLIILAAAVAFAMPLAAQEKFPSRNITMIVPTPPAGGVDIVHRMLGELAEPTLGVKIVVENKPGASGTLGLSQLARAKPDGYTIAAVWNAPLTIAPHTLAIPYATADFEPITQTTGGTPLIFCVRPDFPAKNGKEFVEYVKANPGKLTYGTDGVGAMVQLSGERLFHPMGLKLRAVPFGGAAETLKNFLGGHIDIYGGTIPPIEGQLKQATARCVIATAAERVASLPDAASAGDLGLAGEATELWRGLIAPKGTPPERLKILADAFRKAGEHEKFKAYLARSGERAVFGTPDQFRALMTSESSAFAKVVQQIGISKK